MQPNELRSLAEQGSQTILQSTSIEQMEECIKSIMLERDRLMTALKDAYYIKGVHKYSFGVGDTIESHLGVFRVVQHDAGMLWARKVGEKKFKIYPIYLQDNWKLIQRK